MGLEGSPLAVDRAGKPQMKKELEKWNTRIIAAVGAKHSSRGVKVISASVNKNASPLVEYRNNGILLLNFFHRPALFFKER